MASDSRGLPASSKLRILVSAYGCSPGRGSEPGVGWNWTLLLAQFHEVWVLTPERERAAIDAYPKQALPQGIRFVHFDLPRYIRPRSPGTTIEYVIHYHLWQIRAYFIARKLHAAHSFDIVHHLTVGAYWKPSLLCLLPIPFLWGPLGGGEALPRSFWSILSLKGRFFEACRIALQTLGELDPLVRITARRSTLALAKTEDTARRVRALKSPQVRLFSEAGLSDAELAELNRLPIAQSGPMRFISIGRLLHWKGFELGLRAFAKLGQTHPDATYCVVGDGPERRRLEQISQRLGLSGRVEFCGKLLRADVLGKLSDCDVLVHPSLHDSGGWVCLEAMAAGRPVICLDHGGPSTQVTRETGFKISARTPGQCIEDIASAMRLLASDRLLAAKMGLAGRKHVNQQFAWSQKAPAIVNLYESCSTQRQPSDWSATHVGV